MKRIIIFLLAIFLCLPAISVENIISAGVYVSPISIVKKYKDINHNWRTLNQMKTQAKNLSNDEKSVIQKYFFGAVKGEDTFLLINCNLRGTLKDYIPKKEITKPLQYRLDYYADQLNAAVFKTKLPQNVILYRSIDDKEFKLVFADKKVGDFINKPISEENLKKLKEKLIGATYVEKGFLSTSYDINCLQQSKFVFEINAPKNLQAVLLEDFDKKSEKEVLINRNTKWEIVDISIDSNKKLKYDYYRIKLRFVKK